MAAIARAVGAGLPVLPLMLLAMNDPRWGERRVQAGFAVLLVLHALINAVLLPVLSAAPRDPQRVWPGVWLALLLFVLVAPSRWRSWLR